MSYANAVPKALKFLVSDGDLIDEDGNVIAHSDTLKDMYDQAVPEVRKYLLSDGSVVDEDNNLIIKNAYFKKVYDQAVPKVAKYLHSDGTIDENPGSGADLEDNHQTTIDVSTYTLPVEVTPTQGKDGMKKATITLDNIPSSGVTTLYNWNDGSNNCYTTTPTPTTSDKALQISSEYASNLDWFTIDSVTEEGIILYEGGDAFVRNPTGDISLI